MSSLPPLGGSRARHGGDAPGAAVRDGGAHGADVRDGGHGGDPAEGERYSRSVRLPGFGLGSQGRLVASRVLVVGAGGLGAPVIQYLAASGVGTLGIVDDDAVDLSNLQRQVLFRPDQVGFPKARAAADWVRAANPDVTVVAHPVRLSERTADLLDDYDLVVDGSDSFDTCYLVADAAAARGLPVVWGSVNRWDGQFSVFWDDAPDGRAVDYRDLHPAPPASGWDESCADVGVLGPLCGTVGAGMAGEVVKLLTGLGEPLLGRVVTVDALGGTWRESRLARAAHRVEARATVNAARRASSSSAAGASAATAGGPSRGRGVGPDVDADELSTLLEARAAGDATFTLLDVREVDEHDFAHITGDVQAPGYGTRTRQRPELDPGHRVVVYCARGPRARAAADLLAGDGFDVSVLHGGMLGWQLAQGTPTRP
ncbi:HesA/MoeB/ThiF family protein [Frigoribacterium sp. PhB24]|uniref:HesA/MoeB/ThiF family protein n=1 Tax=Frigoribacterium sp. PhB24 TaxID=2485204 RepID=UPI000F4683A1|nr:HesA/MoeB/ThiF family protein [Frigoribacterium sp. PhB24]